MNDRFDLCLARVLKHEAGYSDRPPADDPGGPTNLGITQRTFDDWRRAHGQPTKPVRDITREEAREIYREWFWRVAGRGLPVGLDYAVFDFAVNSGPAQAVRTLQRLIGATPDGLIGPQTLARVRAVADVDAMIEDYCEDRLDFMRGLRNWKANANGWTKRVRHVFETATKEAAGSIGPFLPTEGAPGKAPPSATSVGRTAVEVLTDGKTLGAVSGVLGSLATMASGDGPVQWAVAVVFAAAALTAIVLLARRALA